MTFVWRLLWIPTVWAALITAGVLLTKVGAYGAVLFVFLPFMMGVLVELIWPSETKRKALLQGAASAAVGCAFFIVVGVEGLICMFMALPLAVPLGMSGSLATFAEREARLTRRTSVLLMLPFAVGSAGYDVAVAPTIYQVTTTIEIAASPETVWQHVISFAEMPKPTDWLFNSGIGYPRGVRLEGTGVGATRYCDFSTGSFVEPITVWEPGKRLEFDVVESAAPMKEWSPYGDIQPAHLHGYFVSRKGRFVLTLLSNGHTLVEGTTWYQHSLEPGPYWRWWSDAIIHRIHRRVLNHVKLLSER